MSRKMEGYHEAAAAAAAAPVSKEESLDKIKRDLEAQIVTLDQEIEIKRDEKGKLYSLQRMIEHLEEYKIQSERAESCGDTIEDWIEKAKTGPEVDSFTAGDSDYEGVSQDFLREHAFFDQGKFEKLKDEFVKSQKAKAAAWAVDEGRPGPAPGPAPAPAPGPGGVLGGGKGHGGRGGF